MICTEGRGEDRGGRRELVGISSIPPGLHNCSEAPYSPSPPTLHAPLGAHPLSSPPPLWTPKVLRHGRVSIFSLNQVLKLLVDPFIERLPMAHISHDLRMVCIVVLSVIDGFLCTCGPPPPNRSVLCMAGSLGFRYSMISISPFLFVIFDFESMVVK